MYLIFFLPRKKNRTREKLKLNASLFLKCYSADFFLLSVGLIVTFGTLQLKY